MKGYLGQIVSAGSDMHVLRKSVKSGDFDHFEQCSNLEASRMGLRKFKENSPGIFFILGHWELRNVETISSGRATI